METDVLPTSACVVLKKARREHQIPLKLEFKQLRATMRVLGVKSGSSARAASALSCCAMSLAPFLSFKVNTLLISMSQCEMLAHKRQSVISITGTTLNKLVFCCLEINYSLY